MSLFLVDAGRAWPGGPRPSFLLARELAAQGFSARLVVQAGSPVHEKAEAESLPLLPLKLKDEFEVGAGYRLARAMRREGCVLAHFHEVRSAAVGAAPCARAKVPLRIVSGRAGVLGRPGWLVPRRHVDSADLVVAASESARDALLRRGTPPERIEIIPPGIDFSAFRAPGERDFLRRELGLRSDDFLVGLTTPLEDEKGHRYLVEAARILKERTAKIKIIILGQGRLELAADSQARDLGLGQLSFSLGFRDEAPASLRSLDCFVACSESGGQEAAVMNAMASRLPVVTTQVAGIADVVLHDETGYLVPPRNPRALAEAIYTIFKDVDLAKRFGDRGGEVIDERFSALAMARRTIVIYKRLAYRKRISLGA